MSKTYTQAQRDADIEAAIDGLEAGFQAKLNMAFDAWNSEREQVFAIVSAIECKLRDEPGRDSPEHNAWRLAEVVVDMLGCARDFNAMKAIAGVHHAD
jgi:hypothetical protein